MTYWDVGHRIVRIAKEKLHYDIPLDADDPDLVVKYVFSEGDPARLNKIVNGLLDEDDKIIDCLWRYFPLNADGYRFDGKARKFAEKRIKTLREYFANEGNLYNRTRDIPFARGRLTPVTNGHREILLAGIRKDMKTKNKRDFQEFDCFRNSIECANRQGGRKPSFAVVDDHRGAVGYISIEEGEYFSMRSSADTYNFEYYVVPEARREGYMKEAIPPLIQAVADGKIRVLRENPLLAHDAKVERVRIRMLNALIYEDNAASIRTIKSTKLFEENGTIKLVDSKGVVQKVKIFSKIF